MSPSCSHVRDAAGSYGVTGLDPLYESSSTWFNNALASNTSVGMHQRVVVFWELVRVDHARQPGRSDSLALLSQELDDRADQVGRSLLRSGHRAFFIAPQLLSQNASAVTSDGECPA